MKTAQQLIESLFSKFVPMWIHGATNLSVREGRGFSIIRLGLEEAAIAVDHWEQMVYPGCHLRMQMQGQSKYVREALAERDDESSDEDSKSGPDIDATAEGVTTSVDTDLRYIAYFYQQDGTSSPDWLREKGYSEPLIKKVQSLPAKSNCILEEVRNVYLNTTKQYKSGAASYDQIESDDIISEPYLRICSVHLLDALKAVIRFQSAEEDEDHDDLRFAIRRRLSPSLRNGLFRFPFSDLYHHKDELLAYRDSTDESRQRHSIEYNQTCDRHIEVLVKYLYDQPMIQLREAEEAWRRENPVTTFIWLWLLLKPGSDVYVREGESVTGYVVESISLGQRLLGDLSSIWGKQYVVKVWNLEFDGKSLSRSVKNVYIPVFDGERVIRSLPIYPIRFHDDGPGSESLRDNLVERGKNYVKIVKQPTFQEYSGPSELHSGRTVRPFRTTLLFSIRHSYSYFSVQWISGCCRPQV